MPHPHQASPHCLSSWLSPTAPCRKALHGRAVHVIHSAMTDVACGITEIQCFSGMPHLLPRSATWQQHQQNTGQYTGERTKESAPGMAQPQASQSPWPTHARFELPLTGGQVGTWNSHTALQQDGTQPLACKVKAMMGNPHRTHQRPESPKGCECDRADSTGTTHTFLCSGEEDFTASYLHGNPLGTMDCTGLTLKSQPEPEKWP